MVIKETWIHRKNLLDAILDARYETIYADTDVLRQWLLGNEVLMAFRCNWLNRADWSTQTWEFNLDCSIYCKHWVSEFNKKGVLLQKQSGNLALWNLAFKKCSVNKILIISIIIFSVHLLHIWHLSYFFWKGGPNVGHQTKVNVFAKGRKLRL